MEIVLKYSGNTLEINRALRGGQACSVKYTKIVFQPISPSEAKSISIVFLLYFHRISF
jgi:hypothetical protein